ncbi:MAG: hypothetical protein KBC67_00060 [Candidatus Pacebacteria bacterium]|nr:hypothetical protein [Candidatus Paceibacterota bacterium]
MYTYINVADAIRDNLRNICERGNILEKDPFKHAYLIKQHKDWPKILAMASNTFEIAGLDFYVADHKKDVIYIYPRLKPGVRDEYYDIRRTMYVKGNRIESESIDFERSYQTLPSEKEVSYDQKILTEQTM